jgi:hypothetical protein
MLLKYALDALDGPGAIRHQAACRAMTQLHDVMPLVGGRVPLREAERALEMAARPGMLKVLIDAS